MSRPTHIRLPTAAVLAALAAIGQAPNAAAFADFTAACAEAFGDEGLDAAGNPPPDPATDPNANASALTELDALTAEPAAEPGALAGWGERNPSTAADAGAAPADGGAALDVGSSDAGTAPSE